MVELQVANTEGVEITHTNIGINIHHMLINGNVNCSRE